MITGGTYPLSACIFRCVEDAAGVGEDEGELAGRNVVGLVGASENADTAAALDSRKAQRKLQSCKRMRRGAAECTTAPTTFARLR